MDVDVADVIQFVASFLKISVLLFILPILQLILVFCCFFVCFFLPFVAIDNDNSKLLINLFANFLYLLLLLLLMLLTIAVLNLVASMAIEVQPPSVLPHTRIRSECPAIHLNFSPGRNHKQMNEAILRYHGQMD